MYYENFKALCDLYKVKPSDITKKTGISSATFSSWKKNAYTPKNEKLKMIAEFFGVSVAALTGESDSELEDVSRSYHAEQFTNGFSKLDSDDRKTVLLMIDALLQKDKYKVR